MSVESRQTLMAFRDDELLRIFRIAVEMLDTVRRSIETPEADSLLEEVLKNGVEKGKSAMGEQGLRVAVSCIAFDFEGKGRGQTSELPLAINVQCSHSSC